MSNRDKRSAARAAFAAMERRAELDAQDGGSERVARRGTGLRDEHAVDDLGDDVLGRGEKIVVGRAPLRRITHERNLPSAWTLRTEPARGPLR